MSRRLLRTGLILTVISLAFSTAELTAQSPIDLEQRVESLESELRSLRQSLSHRQGPATYWHASVRETFSPPAAYGCCPSCNDVDAQFPTVTMSGFIQADWGWFSQDVTNIATVDDIQDGANIRRARLSASGRAWDNVSYFMEFDFAFPGRPSFMDTYLDIEDTGLGTLRFGYYRMPIGMGALTSVKNLTFLERALPFAFLPFRQIGLGTYGQSQTETLTYALSAFRYPTDVFGGNVGDNGGYGMAGRLTYAPWLTADDSILVHLGAAYSLADPANDRIRYRSQPEFSVSETGGADLVPIGVPTSVPVFVDTGPISARNYNLFAVEGAAVLGSLYLQSEAMYSVVDQIGGPTVSFAGAYAQAGYFLTGEVRNYNRAQGVFGQVRPNRNFGACGWGAWEIASRLSYLDLNDANIAGGRLTDFTAGVNWYLNPMTKFQFQYVHAFLDDPITDKSDADIIAVRAQVVF